MAKPITFIKTQKTSSIYSINVHSIKFHSIKLHSINFDKIFKIELLKEKMTYNYNNE